MSLNLYPTFCMVGRDLQKKPQVHQSKGCIIMVEVGKYCTFFNFWPFGRKQSNTMVKNEQVCFILTTLLLHFMYILGYGKSYCLKIYIKN